MDQRRLLSRETFATLAAEAGIDIDGAHGEDLFQFVQATLATIESIHEVDVSGAEPDMAFVATGAG